MAQTKAAKKDTKATKAAPKKAFSDAEMAAMRARAREVKAAARRGAAEADGESDALAAIAAMPAPDRAIAERIHKLIKSTAPGIAPKTWYGMPAYARDGSVVCHFQNASKFKMRYATLGFTDKANLDDGQVWPVAYALKSLGSADEARIAALIRQAMS